ncbi:MAG: sodium:solute symporter family protein [Thermoclostridium sp.]|nr:sodium:solute symporter family protein [Thermoclostridium sp.]
MIKLIMIIIYIIIIGYLSYLGYRRTKTANDYLLGGRQIHPAVMALSYGATFISTSAIVGFGGIAAQHGFSLLWLTFLNIFLGVFVAFIFFGKRTRRMGQNLNAQTFSEFIGERYQSKFIRKFSAIIIFLFMPIYAAAVLIGVAAFIQRSFNIEYITALLISAAFVAIYVFFGGLKGVMYADAFQGSFMIVGMLIFIIFVYQQLGGITSAHERLTLLSGLPQVQEQIKSIGILPGFTGWTSTPEAFSPNWLVVFSSIVLGVGVGALAQPQLVVKYMTVKSGKQLNRAVPVGGIFILMTVGVVYVVGPLTNLYFYEKYGQIAQVFAGSSEEVIPAFINDIMPEWFVAVFMIVAISAGMSTLSSQFHTMGTAVSRDLFDRRDADEKRTMLITRVGLVVGIVITVVLAYVLPKVWNGAIVISTGLFFGICASSFLPLYVAALYSKKISRKAAISGMLAGFTTSMLWMLFVHTKESAILMLCKLIFGVDSLATGTNLVYLDPLIISLSVSTIVTIVAGLFTKQDLDKKHIELCFAHKE